MRRGGSIRARRDRRHQAGRGQSPFGSRAEPQVRAHRRHHAARRSAPAQGHSLQLRRGGRSRRHYRFGRSWFSRPPCGSKISMPGPTGRPGSSTSRQRCATPGRQPAKRNLTFTVSPAASGETLNTLVRLSAIFPWAIRSSRPTSSSPSGGSGSWVIRISTASPPDLRLRGSNCTAGGGCATRALDPLRFSRFSLREWLLPTERPSGVPQGIAHLQSFSGRPASARRSGLRPARLDLCQDGGLQLHPLHRRNAHPIPARPVR